MKRRLKYSKSNVRDTQILFAAFDTETEGLGGKLLSIQAGAEKERNFFTGENMIFDFFAFIQKYPKPYIHYAHVAQYDWRYFLKHIEEQKIKTRICMRSERDIYQISLFVDDNEIIMRDSFALMTSPPQSLKQFGASFAPEIPKLEIDIANYNPENPEHVEYAMRDIEILLVGLPRFDALCRKHFSVGIAATGAATAMKAWQYSIPAGVTYSCSKFDEREIFIRNAYYGGIVFLTTNRTIQNCETYDINSSYPYVMETYTMPSGTPTRSKNWQDGKLGIYKVLIKTPDDLIIPILPARNENGGMRWQRGTFETIVTNVELIFAAQHGYEILDVLEGLIFPDRIDPFKDFVGLCKKIRKEYPKQTEESIAKLMQNALYGKFGTKRIRSELFHPENDDDMIGAFPFGESDYWYTRTQNNIGDMACRPEWAVFITAFARIRLLEQAYKIGVENVIYGDTDSLTVLVGHSESIDVGLEYGQFKLEKTWRSFRVIAPKVYVGEIGEVLSGRAKGMPKKAMTLSHWQSLYDDGVTNCDYTSLPSLFSHIKNEGSELKNINRLSSTINNSVNFESDNFGNVRPKKVATKI